MTGPQLICVLPFAKRAPTMRHEMQSDHMMMNRDLEIRPERWADILASFRPAIGRHKWLFRLANWRQRRTGRFPMRLYRIGRRLIHPHRPYFIGRTGLGVRY